MAVRVVTFKLSEEDLELLDLLAKRKGWSRSEVIRDALRVYVKLSMGVEIPRHLRPVMRHDRPWLEVEV